MERRQGELPSAALERLLGRGPAAPPPDSLRAGDDSLSTCGAADVPTGHERPILPPGGGCGGVADLVGAVPSSGRSGFEDAVYSDGGSDIERHLRRPRRASRKTSQERREPAHGHADAAPFTQETSPPTPQPLQVVMRPVSSFRGLPVPLTGDVVPAPHAALASPETYEAPPAHANYTAASAPSPGWAPAVGMQAAHPAYYAGQLSPPAPLYHRASSSRLSLGGGGAPSSAVPASYAPQPLPPPVYTGIGAPLAVQPQYQYQQQQQYQPLNMLPPQAAAYASVWGGGAFPSVSLVHAGSRRSIRGAASPAYYAPTPPPGSGSGGGSMWRQQSLVIPPFRPQALQQQVPPQAPHPLVRWGSGGTLLAPPADGGRSLMTLGLPARLPPSPAPDARGRRISDPTSARGRDRAVVVAVAAASAGMGIAMQRQPLRMPVAPLLRVEAAAGGGVIMPEGSSNGGAEEPESPPADSPHASSPTASPRASPRGSGDAAAASSPSTSAPAPRGAAAVPAVVVLPPARRSRRHMRKSADDAGAEEQWAAEAEEAVTTARRLLLHRQSTDDRAVARSFRVSVTRG